MGRGKNNIQMSTMGVQAAGLERRRQKEAPKVQSSIEKHRDAPDVYVDVLISSCTGAPR